jgi:hypothetical protein
LGIVIGSVELTSTESADAEDAATAKAASRAIAILIVDVVMGGFLGSGRVGTRDPLPRRAWREGTHVVVETTPSSERSGGS